MNHTLFRASLSWLCLRSFCRPRTRIPPMSETYPIDVTIAQNQPLEIVRPRFLRPGSSETAETVGRSGWPATRFARGLF